MTAVPQPQPQPQPPPQPAPRPLPPRAALLAELDAAPFAPWRLARGGFAQTLAAAYLPPTRPPLRLERWDTPDGDFVRVHFGPGAAPQPLLLVLHGLEGSVRSPYIGALATAARAHGWQLAVLEFRSCGGEPNRLPRSYHSGETGDLDFVVAQLVARDPGRPLAVVGYSLGGNVLLKWLGERGAAAPPPLFGAAAVSAPFDLGVAAACCDTRHGGLIARHFLRTLVPKALHKARQFPGRLDAAAVRRCRSFRAFDDLVTAPLHGFRDAVDYWTTQSCARFLPGIRVPTLLLNAADDPLVPAAVLPHAAAAASPWLLPRFTARGGHCGFVAGPWWPWRWAEAQVLRGLAALLPAAVTGTSR